ncbi:MAG TPA: hypothetical protein VH186_36005 [Chloroflexia bacterium]|nr:hypothetical protein [Chloroflexia bacterium]
MTFTITLLGLIAYFILGLIGGTVAEQVANRKFWPPVGLIGAVLVAFGGAVIGAWLIGYVLGFRDPSVFDIPIIPAIIGAIIFLIPWFMVRGGYTSYGRKRTWQRKYRR